MRTLEGELMRHAASDVYPFHMPGHKGRGDEIQRIDITEIDGFDNLHDPEEIILEEMERAAAFYGTKRTYFSVNGSTCALLAAISAAVPRGGTLLMERGCHMAVYHAAYLRDLHLQYIDYPTPEDEKMRTPDAVVITSPSYEGCVKHVEKWAAFAHERGIPLIVDEAHGAHFSMHPYFPKSAIHKGADLVIQSVHKTLPAMTQTALLHLCSDRVDPDRIQRFFDIYETSSPSYVLMASITRCLHMVSDPQSDLFDRYVDMLKDLREKLAHLAHLHLAGGGSCILTSDEELPPFKAGTRVDPGKIVITTTGSALTGPELYDRLREEYHLQPEMKAPDSCLMMTSPFDTQEGFDRLLEALREIDRDGGLLDI
ncbi:MAG: decarboxylase [Lachnospiraceae bacterium]|nr:decarboxylase [Lachnospiraceae bacterium]